MTERSQAPATLPISTPAPWASETEPDRSLRHSVRDGCAHAVMLGAGEAYIGPYAIALGAGSAVVGLIASLPFVVGSFAQLASNLKALFLLSGVARLLVTLIFVPLLREVREVEHSNAWRVFVRVVGIQPIRGLRFSVFNGVHASEVARRNGGAAREPESAPEAQGSQAPRLDDAIRRSTGSDSPRSAGSGLQRPARDPSR